MALEFLQQPLYLITVLLAFSTAISGIILVNHLFKNKASMLSDKILLFVFSFIAFGYSCFALAEVTWYLIFTVFQKVPSNSMPDFYWVVGSIFLLIGFVLFSIYVHKQHGDVNKGLSLLLFAVVVIAGVIFYMIQMGTLGSGKTTADIFLGHFYPIISSLILIASFSVYLFYEKIGDYQLNFLLFLFANAVFLIGDLLYGYYNLNAIYGFIGVLSDCLYIVSYSLCSISFISLIMKTSKKE